MDTTLNTPQKKIDGIKILHLDAKGYGPEGKHTRDEWRGLCLHYLLAGKDDFESWQGSWFHLIDETSERVSFEYELTYDDGNIQRALLSYHSGYSFDYAGVLFSNSLNCDNFVFKHSVLFSGAKFCEDTFFKNAYFKKHAHFRYTNFAKRAVFNASIFANDTYFMDALFSDEALFEECRFIEKDAIANYINVRFEKIANFKHVEFHGRAEFSRTIFFGYTYFWYVNCHSYINFDNTIFYKMSYFNNANFLEEVYFKNANFYKHVFFFETIFQKQCRFDNDFGEKHLGTKFHREANFEKATFNNIGYFNNVQFLGEIPSFLGVDNATTRFEFSDEKYFSKLDVSEDAVKKLGLLKRLADEHGQIDQALNFNALELRAKAKQPRAGWGVKLVTALYEHVSDFGRSFFRPFAIYASILFLTFLVALEHSAYNAPRDCAGHLWWQTKIEWKENPLCQSPAVRDMSFEDKKEDAKKLHLSGIRAASEYTLYRAAGVLDFSDNGKATDAVARRLFGQSIEPWWMRIWGVFKAIASTALLFLAALGLRNKYRIK